MPWNGSGTATRIYNWVNDKNASIAINASRMDGDSNDFVSMINNTLCKDGQNTPTATLPMGTYRHTGVGNAAARTDYAAAGQVQDDTFTWGATSAGSANAQTIGPTPAIAAYASGQRFRFIAGYSNSGAATLAVSGLATKNIYKITGSGPAALVGGEIIVGNIITVQYDGTQFQLIGGNALTLGTVTSVGSGTGLTGGPITGSGTLSLATIADKNLLANTSGSTAAPIATTLTAFIDEAIDNTQGDILYRSSSVWTQLAAGISGQFLQTGGSSANPKWSNINSSGFVNILRGNSLSAWFHGTTGTITTAGGWSAEGVYIVPTGASVTFSQLTSGLAGPGYYALQITGAASVNDLIVRFIVDGATATKLFAQNSNTQAVTFQMTVYTSVGSSLTPKITVKHAGSFNNWGSPTTDVNAQSMQAIANNTVTTISYTWTIASGTQNGLSIDIDFGNNFGSNSDTINIYSGFDLRATPGVSTGINNSPPAPEIRDIPSDIAWNQRFFYSTYENGTVGGTSTANGAPLIYGDAATTLLGLQFPVPMIAAPTCSMWDLAGTSNKVSAYNGATLTNGFATASISTQDTKRVVVTQAGAAARVYSFQTTCDATITGA